MSQKDKKPNFSRKEFINLSGIISASLFFVNPKDFLEKSKAGSLSPGNYPNTNEVIETFVTKNDVLILTIDDGWYYNSVEEMLGIMKEKKVKSTLFLVGHVLKNSEIAELTRQAAKDGHEISYHSMKHSEMEITEEMTTEEWLQDYDEWLKLIKKVLGQNLFEKSVRKYARAPGGAFTFAFMEMCLENDLLAMGWSSGPQTINRKIYPKKGDIYLGHFRQPDIDLLHQVVNEEFGLRPVSIGEYFELESPKYLMDRKNNPKEYTNWKKWIKS